MPPPREDPIVVPAQTPTPDPAKSAAFIFIHGLGDSAQGLAGLPAQFQNAGKLPHLQWTLPNAMENMDAMMSAWYMPTGLSPFPPSRPELEEDEDEDGMKISRKYIVSLIDDLIDKQGIPANRIVLGGFSQGCAMTLLTGLTSKYAGKLAGLVGICGYLPLAEKIEGLREEEGLGDIPIGDVPMFIARGGKDMMIPRRHHNIMLRGLERLGVKDNLIELHEVEGMGHGISGPVIRQLCTWMEKVVPPVA